MFYLRKAWDPEKCRFSMSQKITILAPQGRNLKISVHVSLCFHLWATAADKPRFQKMLVRGLDAQRSLCLRGTGMLVTVLSQAVFRYARRACVCVCVAAKGTSTFYYGSTRRRTAGASQRHRRRTTVPPPASAAPRPHPTPTHRTGAVLQYAVLINLLYGLFVNPWKKYSPAEFRAVVHQGANSWEFAGLTPVESHPPRRRISHRLL